MLRYAVAQWLNATFVTAEQGRRFWSARFEQPLSDAERQALSFYYFVTSYTLFRLYSRSARRSTSTTLDVLLGPSALALNETVHSLVLYAHARQRQLNATALEQTTVRGRQAPDGVRDRDCLICYGTLQVTPDDALSGEAPTVGEALESYCQIQHHVAHPTCMKQWVFSAPSSLLRDMAAEFGLPPRQVYAVPMLAGGFDASRVHLWVLVRFLLILGDMLPVDKWWIGGSFVALTWLVIRTRAATLRHIDAIQRLYEPGLDEDDFDQTIANTGLSITPSQTCPACRQPLHMTLYIRDDTDTAHAGLTKAQTSHAKLIDYVVKAYRQCQYYVKSYVFWPDVAKRASILGWCLTVAWCSGQLKRRIRRQALVRIAKEGVESS
ncbi:hypothetical protein BZG36_01536 [Bifiguratus adelaidae]|uniref:Uncharacterized protein n=1 Tax=Bifiguratus adelaidae TaxID=1938954 RepID=A0A261Y421_9FUNG|nr:hypothetical protein BZG36_01536 [Bifiguratus adelaidae]